MHQKLLKISLVGITNAGKSTLLNKIIGETVSIINKKINTTQDLIKGIINISNIQIIFYDTPGLNILKHKDKIIGIGLDSSELENPPKKFEKLFQKAIKEGFLTVAHAGEGGPPEHIWDSINLLKVKRIDHGVQCFHDEKLVVKLRNDQIPLTVCPLSNVKLCVFEKLENHNLKRLLDKGLMVTVNSDDPAYFGGYLNRNMIDCQKALNLSMEDVKKLAINSFKSSFLSEDEKKKWIDQINNLS